MLPATSAYFYREKRAQDGLYARCKTCHNKASRKWQKAHPEAIQVIGRRYQERHPGRIREMARRSRQKNRPKALEREREYYRKNTEKVLAKNKRYREKHPEIKRAGSARERREHPERIAARQKRYRERNYDRVRAKEKDRGRAHPEWARIAYARRRARKLKAEGNYSHADVLAQHKRQKDVCYWCNEPLNSEYEIDHVIPLSRGGDNSASNIVCVHVRCNRSKSDKLPHEWEGSGGKLL